MARIAWTEKKLANRAAAIVKILNIRGAALDIFLLPNREIKALKAKFIKKKTEPNVLAFREPVHFPHPEARGKKYIGEIYLNKEILKRSPERAVPLLLHGILHLAGYDHIRKADAKAMEALEARILSRLNRY